MNILQGLQSPAPLLVTLNRSDAIDPAKILKRVAYQHPLYGTESVAAQTRHRDINGQLRTYFCGAWWQNGFHEDGVVSALKAVQHFRADHAQRAVFRSA
jgi:predicted NAD/FAD-binding protein